MHGRVQVSATYVALDRLDGGVGADLHVSGAKEGGAGVAAGDGHDGGHHEMLNEGARNDDLDRVPVCVDRRGVSNGVGNFFGILSQ